MQYTNGNNYFPEINEGEKMSTIKALSEHLTNQIAAGEVIERPSSVVKELIENSIDANSTQIEIFVEEAGLQKIKVTDNGDGIHPDEVKLAFERHATSKIYTQEDLFRIHSLGFRGEALPSIASVSKVTIETATEGMPGKYLRISGGIIEEEKSIGTRKGSSVTVENLFFNTPARLKYIKTLQTELSSITDIINRISLSHPAIAFRLVHDGNQLLRTAGNGDLQQAVAGVYGTKTARKMLAIQSEDLYFQITGLVSIPEVTRASRNYVTVILNGRYIRNYNLQKAIIDGYGSRLMIGRYPIAIINIETDALLLDVNVHPSKREVRISKEKELQTLLNQAIQEAMNNVSFIPSGLENLSFKRESTIYNRPEQMNVELEDGNPQKKESQQVDEAQDNWSSLKNSYENILEEERGSSISIIGESNSQHTVLDEQLPVVPEEHDEPVFTTVKKMEKEVVIEKTFPQLYYFGQMHGTYLFAQNEHGLYMIDQHAAQERIKYEYYREEIAKVSTDSQGLLIPITIELPLDEFIQVKENLYKLEEIGISLQSFGKQTFLLDQHPVWFASGQEEAIVNDILQMLLKENNISIKKLREAAAIMMSCKRSIKANHYINEAEAKQLLKDLAATKNPYNCPHGRPVLIHFTNNDIEKMFKRIQDPH